MNSMKSRGYVRETFNWQWFYWYLTNEGIEYLREYLHLPAEIVPATLKKQAERPAGPRSFGGDRQSRDGGRFGDKGRREGREGREGGFKPSFRREGREGREQGYRREGGFGGRRE